MGNFTQFISSIYAKLTSKTHSEQKNDSSVTTILCSWQLVEYTDSQGGKTKCRWEEIWSFAAMDETETYGIYACDINNQSTIIGKWDISTLGILRVYYDDDVVSYQIIKLSESKLMLNKIEKTDSDNYMHKLFFEKVVW